MKDTNNNQAYIWKPKALDGIFLFKAQFKRFAYNKHTHREFAIGVVERGTPKCYHKGATQVVPSGAIITVNPGEIHTGEAATNKGYQYRMAYIPPEFISEFLHDLYGTGVSLAYFRSLVTFDNEISHSLLHALRLLDQKLHDLLEAQICFIQAIAELFMRYGQPQYSPQSLKQNPGVIRKACEFIHEKVSENISLEDISCAVGVSHFHFLRLFKATTGFSPHAYLIQRRIEIAKTLIEHGNSLVQAALEAGFSDQSHMTRRFKTTYGVTPGQYQKAIFSKK